MLAGWTSELLSLLFVWTVILCHGSIAFLLIWCIPVLAAEGMRPFWSKIQKLLDGGCTMQLQIQELIRKIVDRAIYGQQSSDRKH